MYITHLQEFQQEFQPYNGLVLRLRACVEVLLSPKPLA